MQKYELNEVSSLCINYDVDVLPKESEKIEVLALLPRQQTEWQALEERKDAIDKYIEQLNDEIDETNLKIKKLTNDADKFDIIIAACSGVLCGLLDIICVGEFSFEKASKSGEDTVNKFVIKVANKVSGKDKKIDNIDSAIAVLEKKYPFIGDKATNNFGGGYNHHLRDFTHHPSIIGLICSIYAQFTGKIVGTDVNGRLMKSDQSGNIELVGKNVSEKIVFGTVNWFFHLVSDMAGSSSSRMPKSYDSNLIGTGIPGPILSFAKELSALPFFRNINIRNKDGDGTLSLSQFIAKIFNGTEFADRDENGNIIKLNKFDLRTEVGMIKQQAWPVLINEFIVRGFYFVRRFITEVKNKNVKNLKDLKKINVENVIPFRNRTVIRMLTISTGTFEMMDVADAAIESFIKSGGFSPAFIPNFLLRFNFVGIGRFCIAVNSDLSMGAKKTKLESQNRLRQERINVYTLESVAIINLQTKEILHCTYEQLSNLAEQIVCDRPNIFQTDSIINERIDKWKKIIQK